MKRYGFSSTLGSGRNTYNRPAMDSWQENRRMYVKRPVGFRRYHQKPGGSLYAGVLTPAHQLRGDAARNQPVPSLRVSSWRHASVSNHNHSVRFHQTIVVRLYNASPGEREIYPKCASPARPPSRAGHLLVCHSDLQAGLDVAFSHAAADRGAPRDSTLLRDFDRWPSVSSSSSRRSNRRSLST